MIEQPINRNETCFFSIVIPTYNRKVDVLNLLATIYQQTYSHYEVIVCDDCSTDDSVPHIKLNYPDVKIIQLDNNSGPAVARNKGIKSAMGEVIIGLDSDVLLPDNDFLAQVNQLFHIPQLFGAAFRIQNYYSERDDSGRWWHPLPIEKFRDKPFWTDYFSGTGYAFRREVFEKAGYYPEDLFMDMEENDLAFRLLEAGIDIRYSPEVWVIHKASEVSKNEKIQFYYKRRNQFWVACRYYPWWKIPLYMIPRWIKTFFSALRHQKLNLYFLSLKDSITNIPTIVMTRKPLSPTTWRKIYLIKKRLYKGKQSL
ncbi:Glycosyl transferase, family 2 [Beggiatoa sp. PS]|nr:Glycosyl transferase, family 2 [Beggiatoa sp. PS]